MAPAQIPHLDKGKKLRTVLTFIVDLEARIPTALSSTPAQETLLSDVRKIIANFPTRFGASAASKCEEIDSYGTSLWNLCTRLRRSYESEHSKDTPAILNVIRVFAFLLLDSAVEAGKNTSGTTLRLMKIGLKAAKNCVQSGDLELSLKVLEKLGVYEEKLLKANVNSTTDDVEVNHRLIAEFFVLRTVLAWRQGNVALAEHMFSKCLSLKQLFDPSTAESLADVLDDMGKDLLLKKQYETAVKWLDRALDVLAGQELDRLSMDASELRISILESDIKALLALDSQATVDKARQLIDTLERDIGDKLIVLLLRLQLLSSATNETFDCGAYGLILRKMILSTALNVENFKLILHHIRKLNGKSPSLAVKALDELMVLRVLKQDKEEWIEKVLVTRLYMTLQQKDDANNVSLLEKLFSIIIANIKHPLSSTATLATHTLIWKRIESCYTQQQHEMTIAWCRLALHPIFENAGALNTARISRKLLLCALARDDFDAARDIYGAMSEIAKNEALTRFLMYKIAIRCGEVNFAVECLESINHSSPKDPTLLYACVLDAQQVGDKLQTLKALQLVLENFGYGAPGTVHLPSLLRLTIGLTIAIIDKSKNTEGTPEADATVETLCKLFEGGVSSMRKAPPLAPGSEALWTVAELDWFSKSSYNLSIDNLPRWAPRQALRMLQCCIAFIDHYPRDMSEPIADDLCLRKLFCEFSAATALTALARGEDNIEARLQDYLTLRKHVASFDDLLQPQLEKMEEGPAQDLMQKLSVLIAFEFEAACQLKAWDDLGEVILKAEMCKELRTYELMADCILCSKPPTQVLVTTLKKIVNEAWGLGSVDCTKLAKYMRCLFQVAMSDSLTTAEQLLGQIWSLAEEAAETEQPYPAEELEWVTTRAFNHAVDLYCNDDDVGCKTWAGQAFSLAHLVADGGALGKLLQSKYMGLKFDV